MPVFEIYDDKPSRRIEIDSKRITIGRTADNGVIIDDRQASRRHCEIRLSEIGYIIRDLKSRNGTLLNQELINRPMPLRDGDEIGIGTATVRFWSTTAQSESSGAKLPLITARQVDEQPTSPDQPFRPELKTTPSTQPKKPISKDKSVHEKHQMSDAQSQIPDIASMNDVEIDWRLTEVEPPPSASAQHFDGTLTINHIIPLNVEGKPAHPVGKDASEVSQAMLRLKQLLLKSFQYAATDIHVEPKEKELLLRYRIDGCLHHSGTLDSQTARSVYSIVKLLCNLDINKKNIMQDGSFAVQLPDRRVDLRVSIAPSTLGDKMVIRVLDKSLTPQGLHSLGMDAYILEQIRQKALQESSMIVSCGPTGSGKTTTVYAILQEMNTRDRNVVTVEDPVEYKLENVTQIQVNPRFNVTFASALASLLRQDPDVILIGEMRDTETARMAVQSAMTGHLVLSTLHARDSIGSIFRLLDLGIEPFLLGSALSAVLSQRLLRRLCPRCKMKSRVAVKELTRLGLEDLANADLYSAVGCDACMGIGYKGRLAVFELLEMTDQVRDTIVNKPTINQLRIAAGDWIFQTLREDGIRKLRQGLISIDEFKVVSAKG